MPIASPKENKVLVLEAFDALFNRRDYAKAQRYWSDHYIQHSAHIPPGRDGLFNRVRGLPDILRYENHLILAEGDYVIAHGRFSGHGRPAAWVAADVVRFEDGKLAEHWDVLQGRSNQIGILEWTADVWRAFPGMTTRAQAEADGQAIAHSCSTEAGALKESWCTYLRSRCGGMHVVMHRGLWC